MACALGGAISLFSSLIEAAPNPANVQSSSVAMVVGQSNQPAIDPTVITTIEHYEIRGENFDSLRQEIAAKGHGGAGSVSAEVTYRFKSERIDGMCEIREVRASCKSKVRLPRWFALQNAPAAMQTHWQQAYEKLKAHEMGHVAICVEVAKDVERAIWKVQASSHCYGIDQEAYDRAAKIVKGMDARQRAFDVREYGSTQLKVPGSH